MCAHDVPSMCPVLSRVDTSLVGVAQLWHSIPSSYISAFERCACSVSEVCSSILVSSIVVSSQPCGWLLARQRVLPAPSHCATSSLPLSPVAHGLLLAREKVLAQGCFKLVVTAGLPGCWPDGPVAGSGDHVSAVCGLLGVAAVLLGPR